MNPKQSSMVIDKIRQKIISYKHKRLEIDGLIQSAVLVPILSQNESILFIKRSMSVKDHKGQIAFPGGVINSTDLSPIETALRETKEEVGIDPQNIETINFIDDTITIAGYLIHPVVGIIRGKTEILPNRDEVDEVFLIPIRDILNSEVKEDPERFSWEFRINGITIWGATARILKNFIEICETL